MDLYEVDEILEYLKTLKEMEEEHLLLFHGTCFSAFNEIAESGTLIPQKKNGSDAIANGYPKENFLGYVFLTSCEYDAGHYSSLASYNLGEYYNGNILTIIGAIVPKQLLLPDLCENPRAKDWKESIETTKSVCVKGNLTIPKENLFLLFTEYEKERPLYLTTELNGAAAFEKALLIRKQRVIA